MLKVEGMVKLFFFLCILLSHRIGYGNYIRKSAQIKKVAESFSNKVGKSNIMLGTMSRSWGVGVLTKYLRDGSIDDVRESLYQTIATLFTLDLAGGFVAPWIDDLIMDFVEKKEFENTRLALQNIDDDILDLVMKTKRESLHLGDDPDGLNKFVEHLKKNKKEKVLKEFDKDLERVSRNPNYSGRKYLRKAKRLLRLKHAGKVLGPIFDMAAIGINAWALSTTLRDCHEDPQNCNNLGIASASLSIAAGVVGIGTFVTSLLTISVVAPVIGAVVGTVLGLAATIVEIISHVQAIQEKRETREKEYVMAELEYKSKIDLYNANRTKRNFGIGDKNIYVVNQGHLPKFFNYHPPEIKFGSGEMYSSQSLPKCVEDNAMCRTPLRPHSPKDRLHPIFESGYICRYLVDGKKFTNKDNKTFGYDFYGFAKNYGQYLKKESPPAKKIPNNGVAVLVETKWVQPHELSKVNEDWEEISLRGLNIDTSTRAENHEDTVDDTVSIDNMPNLDTQSGSDAVLVHVRTGLGDDALIIKGRFGPFTSTNVLKADLGEGSNTVNFNRINSSSNIKGIIFNATTGDLYYKYGLEQKLQHVGKISGVNSVTASPFNDEIQLSTSTVGSADDKYDFVVVKKKGSATYRIDISALAKLKKTKRFLIVDNTKRLLDTMDSYFIPPLLRHRNTMPLRVETCKGHAPLLQLFNFPSGAKMNDILYKNNQIFVYALRNSKYGSTQNSHPPKFQSQNAQCTGERGIWRNKKPLAIISLRSSCPIEIEAKYQDGEYVMTRRKKYELDTRFFCGRRLRIDFSKKKYNGKNLDDYAVLKCPSNGRVVTEKTRIYLKEGNNYLVIGDELFLKPCGIDGDRVNITLVKNKGSGNGWSLVLTGRRIKKFSGEGLKIKIKGVKMIVNEAGNHVVDLSKETKNVVNLYEKYVLSKIIEVAERFGRDEMNEIKDELLTSLTCIQESGNITDEERNKLCEPNE